MMVLAFTPDRAFCQGNGVAVFPFKNNGQPQHNGLASGIASMFTTNLTKSKALDVVDPQRVSAALGRSRQSGFAPSVEDAIKAARSIDADYAVLGEFIVFGNKFRIDLRLYDVKSGTLKVAEKAQAKEDDLFDMVDGLSNKVIMDITGIIPVENGGVQVNSEPPGALVLMDDTKAGQTPVRLHDAAPGAHKVELDLDGYRPYVETVSVKEGEITKLDVKLVRLYGGIRVWWKMNADSDVSIGGETVKASLFQTNLFTKFCKNLPSGTYTVTVRMPYKEEAAWDNARTWRTYATDVDVLPGEVLDVFVNNNLYSPGIEVSACGSCAATWDFSTDIVWYESQ